MVSTALNLMPSACHTVGPASSHRVELLVALLFVVLIFSPHLFDRILQYRFEHALLLSDFSVNLRVCEGNGRARQMPNFNCLMYQVVRVE